MSAARPPLVYDAAFEEVRERRAHDRRANHGRMRLDGLFAATLVNHIVAPERVIIDGYRRQQSLRSGVAVNVKV